MSENCIKHLHVSVCLQPFRNQNKISKDLPKKTLNLFTSPQTRTLPNDEIASQVHMSQKPICG